MDSQGSGGKGRKKFGEYLIDAGLIDEKTLNYALDMQKLSGKKVGVVLMEMGVADDVEIARTLSAQLNIPFHRIDEKSVQDEAVALVPGEIARRHTVMPLKIENRTLIVAAADPLNTDGVKDIRFIARMPVEMVIAPYREVNAAIRRFYPASEEKPVAVEQALSSDPIEFLADFEREEKDERELLKLTSNPPVVRLANAIVVDAIEMRASDIHIEPRKLSLLIRYRIDGVLREIMKTDPHVHTSLVSRFKIMSALDITIRRKAQDGKFQAKYQGKTFDCRISTIPTVHGEKVTIRILNPDSVRIDIEELAMSREVYGHLQEAIQKPQGIMLVTGPTGSGKSTTLYACLNRLNTPDVNIVTVEDPIEYSLEGINQVQVNSRSGIGFADGLRSILRQDPDIILVGEIRDAETARIACQAAQTGHLVFSTLHTNDALAAVARLTDLGVEPYLIASSVHAILGQRLVRRICPHCRVEEPADSALRRRIGKDLRIAAEARFMRGAGCEACQQSGYSGRVGVYELFRMTTEIRDMIATRASAAQIREQAEKDGFVSMSMDAVKKAMQGITSLDEIYRVTPPVPEDLPENGFAAMGPRNSQVSIAAPAASSTDEATAFPRMKILVADDSEIIRKIVSGTLESHGYEVLQAENGLDALKLAFQEIPDLIVTDYLMPKMDGMALIQKLKSQHVTRHIPIIMISVKDETDSDARLAESGADVFITKPIHAKTLMENVARLLAANPGNGRESIGPRLVHAGA